jgi:hypothetical protein
MSDSQWSKANITKGHATTFDELIDFPREILNSIVPFIPTRALNLLFKVVVCQEQYRFSSI